MAIRQYPKPFYVFPCESVSEAIESYYLFRDRYERQKQHHNDIAQILKTCKNRLEKKILAQQMQLEEADNAEQMKHQGDLIMQDMYRISKGDATVCVIDYSLDPPSEVEISLDTRLSPSQNAQKYYKEYMKKKTALVKLKEQICIAEKELEYANSISASLQTATTATDLQEIRHELSHWSYGRRLTSSLKKPQSRAVRVKPRECKTESGFRIYIGMNNFQNDTVSTTLAEKNDLWFHVKNYHGSHVLLKAQRDASFLTDDIEYAASLAAFYSEAKNSHRVEVDYTFAKNIKKPNGTKPGFVTYKNHKTAIVSPKEMK